MERFYYSFAYFLIPFLFSRIPLTYFELNYPYEKIYTEEDICPSYVLIATFIQATMFALIPCCLIGCLVERIVATVKVATYEIYYYPRFFDAYIIVNYFCAVGVGGLYTFGYFTPLHEAILALAGTAAATLGTVIIIILSERSKHNSSPRYTLSKRYQQLENHKAMKCTVVYVSFAGMMNIIFSVLYLLNQYADSRYWANVAGIAINVHIAIYANIMQYVGYISNRQMYELTSGIAMKKLREI
ncbi:unnamed protein product, partial [Mesorhabditis spiculigera]